VGASARIHEEIGAPPGESVVMLQTGQMSAAREAIGAASYDQWERRGRNQPLDDLVSPAGVARVVAKCSAAR
jgi:hypothetical protein